MLTMTPTLKKPNDSSPFSPRKSHSGSAKGHRKRQAYVGFSRDSRIAQDVEAAA